MTDRFVVRPKGAEKKEDKSVVMTLRLDRTLQEEFDKLSAQSDRSRNELMCMALDEYQSSQQHIEFGKFVCSIRDHRACIDYEI